MGADIKIAESLEHTKDKHLAFKNDCMRSFACRVVQTALDKGAFWPDDIDHASVAEKDRNCIGSCFRWLCNVGIIEKTGAFRRSTAESSNGRTIFEYRLLNGGKAKAFLKRNEVIVQMPVTLPKLAVQEMFDAINKQFGF